MLKIAICEDSDIQREIVGHLLAEYMHIRGHAYSVSCFTSGLHLIEDVKKNGSYDIYLLDHIMPVMTGIELAEIIRSKNAKCKIVFISSDSSAVFSAFKVKAFDFIRKPIDIDRFYDVFDRMIAEFDTPENTSILFKTPDGDKKLYPDDIRYIIKENRCLVCHLDDETVITGKTLRRSMKEALEPLLEKTHFVMCGASMMINLAKVESVRTEEVFFKTGEILHIPVRCYRPLYESWCEIEQ